MVPTQIRWLAPAVLIAVAFAAHGRPDPLDPEAAVPPQVYKPSLAQYKRLSDDTPLPWRVSNDEAARIGGWRAYAREANQPEPAAPTTTEMAKPMPAGHAGHGKP